MKSELINTMIAKVKSLFLIDENATDVEVDQKLTEISANKEQVGNMLKQFTAQIDEVVIQSMASLSDRLTAIEETVLGINVMGSELNDEVTSSFAKEIELLKSELADKQTQIENLRQEFADEINTIRGLEKTSVPGDPKVIQTYSEPGKRGSKTLTELNAAIKSN